MKTVDEELKDVLMRNWFGNIDYKILYDWSDFDKTHYCVVFDNDETIYFIRIFRVGSEWCLSEDKKITIGEIRNA